MKEDEARSAGGKFSQAVGGVSETESKGNLSIKAPRIDLNKD